MLLSQRGQLKSSMNRPQSVLLYQLEQCINGLVHKYNPRKTNRNQFQQSMPKVHSNCSIGESLK